MGECILARTSSNVGMDLSKYPVCVPYQGTTSSKSFKKNTPVSLTVGIYRNASNQWQVAEQVRPEFIIGVLGGLTVRVGVDGQTYTRDFSARCFFAKYGEITTQEIDFQFNGMWAKMRVETEIVSSGISYDLKVTATLLDTAEMSGTNSISLYSGVQSLMIFGVEG